MEFIDDHPVVSHQVSFKNRAEITDQQAKQVKDDMVVAWLVRTRCQPPSYHPVGRDSGERYRFNVQKVEDAVPLDGDLRAQALAYLEHGPDQGYVDFGNPRFQQDELFDGGGDRDSKQVLSEIAEVLHRAGVLDESVALVENVGRLVGNRQVPPPRPEASEPVEHGPLVPVGAGEVERVGSIYRNGRRPASLDVLREAFGDFA